MCQVLVVITTITCSDHQPKLSRVCTNIAKHHKIRQPCLKEEGTSCVCLHLLVMMQAACEVEVGPGMLGKRQDMKACHCTVLKYMFTLAYHRSEPQSRHKTCTSHFSRGANDQQNSHRTTRSSSKIEWVVSFSAIVTSMLKRRLSA